MYEILPILLTPSYFWKGGETNVDITQNTNITDEAGAWTEPPSPSPG